MPAGRVYREEGDCRGSIHSRTCKIPRGFYCSNSHTTGQIMVPPHTSPPHDNTSPPCRKTGFFTGKAGYYARYRRGYPPEVFDAIISRFGLTLSSEILDLGCGTGNVAIPLAERGFHVFAVDPEPEMREEGWKRAEAGHIPGISWMAGADSTLATLGLPRLRLCTMGLSFHWMDRPRVLAILDALIEPGGGIACITRTDGFYCHLHDGWGGCGKSGSRRDARGEMGLLGTPEKENTE